MTKAHRLIEELLNTDSSSIESANTYFQHKFGEIVIALESSGLSEDSRSLLLQAVREYVQCQISIERAYSPSFDLMQAHSDGWSGIYPLHTKRGRAKSAIQSLIGLLKPQHLNVNGYSASDLKNEGGIGNTLWQKIVKASRLKPTDRGNTARRFSNHEIGLLLQGARDVGTAKSIKAAGLWQALLDKNRESLRSD